MEDKKIIIEELSRIKNLMGYDRSKTLNEQEGYADVLKGRDFLKGIGDDIADYGTSDNMPRRYKTPDGGVFDSAIDKGKVPKGSEWINKPGKGVDVVKDLATTKNIEKTVNTAGGLQTAKSVVGGGKNVASGAELAGAELAGAEVAGAEAAGAVGAEVAGAEVAGVVGAEVAGAEVAAVAGAEVVGLGAAGVAGGEAAAAATFLGLGPVGWVALGVIGITALGVWGMTKDDDMGMITRLFDMCKTSPDRKKWKRFLTDDQARALSGKLFKAMDGLGTDEDAVYNVFKSLKSPADFCKVSDVYEKSFDESLLEALDGDFDYGWEPIATSLVDMTKNYAQSEAEDYCEKNPEECAEKLKTHCEKNPKDPKCKDVVKVAEEDKITYKSCDGTYSVGCKDDEDDDVYALQACLGTTKNGKFDKNTEKVLKDKTGKTTITKREIWKLCDDYNRNK
jgi:hypothetical protein